MASFKQHCAFTFWKAAIMKDPYKILFVKERNSMGNFGQIKCLADLPSEKILLQYIKHTVKLNNDRISLTPKQKPAIRKKLIVPDYFNKALNKFL